MFPPGLSARRDRLFADFTKVKRVEITVRASPFPHLLVPLPLAWSGLGLRPGGARRRNFVALSEGFAERLAPPAGGGPGELRTDRLFGCQVAI